VLTGPEAPPNEGPAGTCVNCGHAIPLLPPVMSRAAPIRLPAWLVVSAGLLGAGLVVGVILAVLSNVASIGGWLLIALGVGLVVGMGAFEAGYLDGPKRRLQEYLRRSPAG